MNNTEDDRSVNVSNGELCSLISIPTEGSESAGRLVTPSDRADVCNASEELEPSPQPCWIKDQYYPIEFTSPGGEWIYISDANWVQGTKRRVQNKDLDDLEMELLVSTSDSQPVKIDQCRKCLPKPALRAVNKPVTRMVEATADARRLESSHFFVDVRIHCTPKAHKVDCFYLWTIIKNKNETVFANPMKISQIMASRNKRKRGS